MPSDRTRSHAANPRGRTPVTTSVRVAHPLRKRDAAARLAIADYAGKYGARCRLLPGILTRSVSDALHENASP